MRYFYEKPKSWSKTYNTVYRCNHPLYSECTLYKVNDFGLAVIQQRFDKHTKHIWWGELDDWLAFDIYMEPRFKEIFSQKAAKPDKFKLYPTITVRQLMWELRMKPLKKEFWECTKL